MEFIKKNWAKIAFAALALAVCGAALAGAIQGLDTMVYLGSKSVPFGATGSFLRDQARTGGLYYLAIALVTATLAAYMIIKMCCCKKECKLNKVLPIVLIAVSLISIALVISGIALGSNYLNYLKGLKVGGVYAAPGPYYMTLAQGVTYLVAFGFAPLAYGVKKLFCKKGDCQKVA